VIVESKIYDCPELCQSCVDGRSEFAVLCIVARFVVVTVLPRLPCAISELAIGCAFGLPSGNTHVIVLVAGVIGALGMTLQLLGVKVDLT
jgi:uncharacterized membrane protein YdjX (TVP38/TMEM64 family)